MKKTIYGIAEIRRMRKLYFSGVSFSDIAIKYNISDGKARELISTLCTYSHSNNQICNRYSTDHCRICYGKKLCQEHFWAHLYKYHKQRR